MSDFRNIKDEFKSWLTEDVKNHVQAHTFPYTVCFENLSHDFNLSTIIRNANALGCKKVVYLQSKRHYDKRGTVGTHNYTAIEWLSDLESFISIKDKFSMIIGVDCNLDTDKKIYNVDEFVYPKDCLLVFGSEGEGLSPEMKALCDCFVTIPMYGSVRSFNAGCASAIVMHEVVKSLKKEN